MHAGMQPNGEIPDRIRSGLSILFIGFNPSLKSAQTGHHYASPSNRFWKILYLSGLTERLYSSEEDDKLLAKGFGFTNIVARATPSSSGLVRMKVEEVAEIYKGLPEGVSV